MLYHLKILKKYNFLVLPLRFMPIYDTKNTHIQCLLVNCHCLLNDLMKQKKKHNTHILKLRYRDVTAVVPLKNKFTMVAYYNNQIQSTAYRIFCLTSSNKQLFYLALFHIQNNHATSCCVN